MNDTYFPSSLPLNPMIFLIFRYGTRNLDLFFLKRDGTGRDLKIQKFCRTGRDGMMSSRPFPAGLYKTNPIVLIGKYEIIGMLAYF